MAMKLDFIIFHLQKVLKPKRFEHVLRVREQALLLNEMFNLNIEPEKVQYAAILHDCAKDLEQEYFERFKDDYNLDKNEIFENPVVAHAKLGVIAATEIYGVDDGKILDAIRWHTTGKENMPTLTKLIFIADYIEPGRDFEDVYLIRKEVEKNLDRGILFALNRQINYLESIGAIIDRETIKARDYLQRRENE